MLIRSNISATNCLPAPERRVPVPVPRPTARQRGVSLLFALMTLVALSLAAVSLVRSVDTGALIIGNLGFKEDTLLASDEAARQAIEYVQTTGLNAAETLNGDATAAGYYYRTPDNLDVTGVSTNAARTVVDWKLNGCTDFQSGTFATCVRPVAARIELPNGVWARYFVTRLCTPASTPTDLDCLGPTSTGGGDTLDSGELKYLENKWAKSKGQQYFYRVVVRTEGARGAVSYTETIGHNYAGES